MVNLRLIFEKEEGKVRTTTIIALILVVAIIGGIIWYKMSVPGAVAPEKPKLHELTLSVETLYGDPPSTAINVSIYDKDYALVESVKLEPPTFTTKVILPDLEDIIYLYPQIPSGYYLAGDYAYDLHFNDYVYSLMIESDTMSYSIKISEISTVGILLDESEGSIANMTSTRFIISGNFTFTAGEVRNISIKLEWNTSNLNSTLGENINITYNTFIFEDMVMIVNQTDNDGLIVVPDLAFNESKNISFQLILTAKAFVTSAKDVYLYIIFSADGVEVKATYTLHIA